VRGGPELITSSRVAGDRALAHYGIAFRRVGTKNGAMGCRSNTHNAFLFEVGSLSGDRSRGAFTAMSQFLLLDMTVVKSRPSTKKTGPRMMVSICWGPSDRKQANADRMGG
jgi:hypothetical protein